jgi:hypothetical protein
MPLRVPLLGTTLRVDAVTDHIDDDRQAAMDAIEEGCAVCARITQQMERATRECDRSAETDARVTLRRHVREAHGRELPWPW